MTESGVGLEAFLHALLEQQSPRFADLDRASTMGSTTWMLSPTSSRLKGRTAPVVARSGRRRHLHGLFEAPLGWAETPPEAAEAAAEVANSAT